jgi:aspartate racemase
MPEPLGIVACSAEGAALCWGTISWKAPIGWGRTIIRKSRCTPILSRSYAKWICANDWAGVAELMLSSSSEP